jgi:hypothetical protein
MRLGYCDIEFFVFHYPFLIMSPKFQMFERVDNSAEKLQKLQ